jgi:ribonuclease HII
MMLICGIDEVGRGPLAGPVTAAAVVLPADFPVEILADSKKLSPRRRREIARCIMISGASFSFGWVWPEEIDLINIHNAALQAMKDAYEGLSVIPDRVFVDGLYTPDIPVPCEAVVKGDSKINEIKAASILAKVARDRWMEQYGSMDTRYEFERHKGYPTKRHRELIKLYGLSTIHRRSFRTGSHA